MYRTGNLPELYFMSEYITEPEENRLINLIRCSKAKWTQLSGRRLQNYGGVVHQKGLIPMKLPGWLQPYVDRMTADSNVFGQGTANHVLVNSYNPGQGIMPHEDGPLYHPGVCILSLGAPAVIRFRPKGPTGIDATHPRKIDLPAIQHSSACMDQAPHYNFEAMKCAAGNLCPPAASVLLTPRSLLVFSGTAYTDYTHGIDEVEVESLDESITNLGQLGLTIGTPLPRASERLSLTVRRVLKVLPNILNSK